MTRTDRAASSLQAEGRGCRRGDVNEQACRLVNHARARSSAHRPRRPVRSHLHLKDDKAPVARCRPTPGSTSRPTGHAGRPGQELPTNSFATIGARRANSKSGHLSALQYEAGQDHAPTTVELLAVGVNRRAGSGVSLCRGKMLIYQAWQQKLFFLLEVSYRARGKSNGRLALLWRSDRDSERWQTALL
jgi:hypothetical protein